MKYFIPLLLSVFCANASLVQFTWTNFDMTVSTNDLIVTPTRQPIEDGTAAAKGIAMRLVTTNGFVQKNLLGGFFSVVPYDLDIEPITFEVPNDTNTYNFWDLRRSGGHTYVTAGVLGIIAGTGTTVSPSNGTGFVTVNSTGTGGIGAVANGLNGTTVGTNGNLYTVGLAFAPQIASSTLSNYATVGTNYWYPTNNPQGFISSNQVGSVLGFVTNCVTTNNNSGVTNVIKGIIASTPIDSLQDVVVTSPANGNVLGYLNGNWVNTSVGSSAISFFAPAEFSVAGSGTASITLGKANQNPNLVWAGPASGSAAAPGFRALVAADFPAVSSTAYASNVISGGQITQSAVGSNSGIQNGWFLVNQGGNDAFTQDGGSITNIRVALPNVLSGLVPSANEGTGTATINTFLRGDRTWTAQFIGPFSVTGNFTNTGNVSLDNGAILSDGAGTVLGVKWIGVHVGQGVGLTNVSATNLINVLADARISNNIPRLEAFNLFANNNEFQSNVQFDNGFVDSGASSITPTLVVGSSASIGVSNRFQIFNAQGRNDLEIGTNGVGWFTTNHWFLIDWDGSFTSVGNSNHLVHQLVSESQITANSFFSQNYFGNGGGLSNLTTAAISNLFDSTQFQIQSGIVSITNNAAETNKQFYGDLLMEQKSRLNFGGYFMSNDFANGIFVLTRNSTVLERVDSANSQHIFSDAVVGTATSNNFSGIVKASKFSGGFTNTDSSGGAIQKTDANGHLVDTTDGSSFTSLPTPFNPFFPQALTNLDTRNIALAGTSNNVSGILKVGNLAAGTVTNLASSGNTLAAYDSNGKLINVGTISGGSFSGTTLTITPGSSGSDPSAWHIGGNDVGSDSTTLGIWGYTNGTRMEMRMYSNGHSNDTIMRFETIANSPGVNMYAGDTNGAPDATEFGVTVWGGFQNSMAVNQTAAQIFGGQRNSISAGGGSNFGATIIGGATNVAAGNCSFAIGQASRAINDNSLRWNGIANKIYTSSGLGADNGTVGFAFQGYFEMTNSGLGWQKFYGNAQTSTNTSEANSSTFGFTNATGSFGLLWLTTNSPGSANGNQIINGSLGGSNSVVFGTQLKPGAFQIKTNGDLRIESGAITWLGTATGDGSGLSNIPYSASNIKYATNIASHFADVGNSGTSDTSLYSDSIPASTLGANGNKIQATYGLNMVSSATATRQIKVFFGGTSILDTGAISYPVTGAVDVNVFIIRDSSSSIRYKVNATAIGSNPTNYVSVGKLTGLTLSGANTLEIHGQSAGTGAASNDILATEGNVEFKP